MNNFLFRNEASHLNDEVTLFVLFNALHKHLPLELDAPANLVVRDETESSFTVSWNPVQAEIDGYILTYTHPDGSSEEKPVGPNSTSYVLTGLKPAVLYTVYIRALKGNKASRRISTQAETGVKCHIFLE